MSAADPDLAPSPDACAFFQIRRASRTISRFYDRALRPSGLKITQFSLLSAVRELGPVSITALAEVLGLERTSLSRNLRPLEKQGLIRVSPEGYKRTRTVELTVAGRALWREARGLWEQAQSAIDAHLGAERAAQLRDLLADVSALDRDDAAA